jgi:Flp pilus assembly CpaE family ATPase
VAKSLIDELRRSEMDNSSLISLLSQIEDKDPKVCEYCNEIYKINVNYCSMCGKNLRAVK